MRHFYCVPTTCIHEDIQKIYQILVELKNVLHAIMELLCPIIDDYYNKRKKGPDKIAQMHKSGQGL